MIRALLLAAGAMLLAGCTVNDRRLASAPDSGQAVAHDGVVPAARSSAPQLVTLEVGGMTCQGCVARVQQELAKVPGVHRVDVSLADQRARVVADTAVADTALTRAVRRAGPEFLGIVLRR